MDSIKWSLWKNIFERKSLFEKIALFYLLPARGVQLLPIVALESGSQDTNPLEIEKG